jgi:hypothetical protein
MKYGIYRLDETNYTTYWEYPLDLNEKVEKNGFVKIGETDTRLEAMKVVHPLYKRAVWLNRQSNV